jgi:hypothetical protein
LQRHLEREDAQREHNTILRRNKATSRRRPGRRQAVSDREEEELDRNWEACQERDHDQGHERNAAPPVTEMYVWGRRLLGDVR